MTNAANPGRTAAEPPTEIALAFEPTDEHTVVVRLGKVLDCRNAERFKAACQAMAQAGAHYFILDASEVGVLDSTGLGALFSLQRLLGPVEGTVAFAAPSYPVQTLMNMMKLYRVFPQYRSVEQAREALSTGAGSDRIDETPDLDPEDASDFSLEDALDFSLEDALDSFDETLESPEDASDFSLEDDPWDFFEQASWSDSPPPTI